MKPPRRRFLQLAAGAAVLPVVSQIARAQLFPSRPVTIVVPFAAGGAGDILARIIGQQLEQRWRRPFMTENKPGAGGVIGAVYTAKATPDGHTIMIAPS